MTTVIEYPSAIAYACTVLRASDTHEPDDEVKTPFGWTPVGDGPLVGARVGPDWTVRRKLDELWIDEAPRRIGVVR